MTKYYEVVYIDDEGKLQKIREEVADFVAYGDIVDKLILRRSTIISCSYYHN